jgi:hypothetical protein
MAGTFRWPAKRNFNLHSGVFPPKDWAMGLPAAPVTLSVAQVGELNQKLSDMRHNLNNNLALMVAALELLRRKPETALKMADSISGQTNKMIEEIRAFSAEFEKTFGITRDSTTMFMKAPIPESGE